MAFSLSKFFNLRLSPKETVNTPRRAIGFSGGVVVSEDSAMQVSAFYRGVTYIATQVGKLPWVVKDADNKVLQGPITNLLDIAPNTEMSAMTFRIYMISNALINGNSYAEIERDIAGRPIAMWPLPSRSVECLRTTSGQLVYKITGGSFSKPGEDVYLKPEDMFHIRNLHTKDGIVGQGVVPYAMTALGISLGADGMASNLFANGGLPSGVLEVPGTLSDEAFLRVKASWEENHKGRKSGGVAILEEGMKFTPVAMSPDILQFLESRKFGVLEIARFLGLPPTKLFDTEASTFNNQENSNLEVATDTLDTWCRVFESEADIKLLKYRFNGRRSEFDLYQIFRGDMESRANYFSKMMQTAAMTPNEIRRREGMAPYSEGDEFFLAVNNYSPMSRVNEIIDSQIEKNTSSSSQKDVTPQVQANADELAKAALKFLEK